MKNRYWFTIITSLVAAVFILSLFSGIAAAQKPGEKNGNQEKYANTERQFGDAKQQFDKALKQFNAKKDSKSKEELVLKTQDYIEKAIDHTVSYLGVMKSRAENSENIGIIPFDVSNAHVTQLEQLRIKVKAANTIEELRADNKELKDIYAKIRLETRYDFQILLNNRINKFITGADTSSAKLNTAIQNLKSTGDTSDLEKAAANFKNLMQEVTDDQRKTDALLATHAGFDAAGTVINNKDAEAFLKQVDDSQRDTTKKLKTASRHLQDFVRDYRKLSGGKPVTEGQSGIKENERGKKTMVSGNRTLVANGSGRAVIEGNVTVTLSAINGTLKVSSNAVVTTDGGTNQTLGNGQVKYQGFNLATITGNNTRVEISGNNINLTATCTALTTTCTAVLNGNGTFSVSGVGKLNVGGEWKKE